MKRIMCVCRMNGICVSECVSVRLRGVCGRGVCVCYLRDRHCECVFVISQPVDGATLYTSPSLSSSICTQWMHCSAPSSHPHSLSHTLLPLPSNRFGIYVNVHLCGSLASQWLDTLLICGFGCVCCGWIWAGDWTWRGWGGFRESKDNYFFVPSRKRGRNKKKSWHKTDNWGVRKCFKAFGRLSGKS